MDPSSRRMRARPPSSVVILSPQETFAPGAASCTFWPCWRFTLGIRRGICPALCACCARRPGGNISAVPARAATNQENRERVFITFITWTSPEEPKFTPALLLQLQPHVNCLSRLATHYGTTATAD